MAYPYKKMTPEDFDYIRSVTAPERVWIGDEIATEYYRDEMPEYGVFQPELYAEVLNKEEISAIMAYAYRENIPVVCRGAGTGLAGGATCKYGGIMLSVMRMNKIFPVDHKNQTITAEPGALLVDIQAAASAEGLFYPPDPGEKTASIGGNVITNAGGMKAVRYGLTRDFVRCIEAVLPDGSIMNFSSNVVKNTTGYDIKDLVIGSEGTLCILTQVTLKLLPAPTCTCTLVMPFRSLEECADMVPKVLELPFVPTAIEFLERELIDIVERNLNKMFPVKQGDAVLIVMYDASSREELDSAVEAAAQAALANGALDCCIAGTPERAGSVWAVRAGILEGMKADSVAQEECDVVVPRSRIAEYVKAAKRIALSHGIRVEPCGHCGDGNIHTEMLRGAGMSDEEWKQATHDSLTELYALSKDLGGQLSGEHGIGNGRISFLEEFVGPRMIALYKAIKLAFDDKLILNPGKVIEFNQSENKTDGGN
ncbi:MAG: FAD-binding oxidoreductase [Fusicatenibacter sp.]|nr:FAD-binding protein [Fusicatenibacter sp.]